MDDQKRKAAAAALELVTPGMRLGLGTGSTAACFVEQLGARVKAGLQVVCVPTSEQTRLQAESLGIPLTTLDEVEILDLTVDGADELDAQLRLIKGGGGALLREKIVAYSSQQMVVIADAGKLVQKLGKYPLPVEVVPFGWTATRDAIESGNRHLSLAAVITRRLRADGHPFLTENGNFILDCAYGQIEDPQDVAALLEPIPGVVEHGLFLDLATMAFVVGADGVKIFDLNGLRS
jgi:ribose 5-phosphate isomerase A